MNKHNPKTQKRTSRQHSSACKSLQHSSKSRISTSCAHNSSKRSIIFKSIPSTKLSLSKHILSPSSISLSSSTTHTISTIYLPKSYISTVSLSLQSFSQPFHKSTSSHIQQFHKQPFSSTKSPPKASSNEICEQLLDIEAQVEGVTIEMLKNELQSESPALDFADPTAVVHAISEHNMRHAEHHPNSHSFRYKEDENELVSKSTTYTPTSHSTNSTLSNHAITQDDAELVSKLITLTEPESRMLFDDSSDASPQVYFAINRHSIIDPPGYKDGLPIIDADDDATPVPIGERQHEHRFQKVEEKLRNFPPIIHHDPPTPALPPHFDSEIASSVKH